LLRRRLRAAWTSAGRPRARTGTRRRRSSRGSGDPRGVHRLDPHLLLENARVVHQAGNSPESLPGRLEQPDDIRFDGHVRGNRHRFAAARFDLRDERLGLRAGTPVIDADGVATAGRQPRGSRTDATARAGNEEDFAV
jgi:hypothetical protein